MAYTSADVNVWYNRVQFRDGPTADVNSFVSALNAGTLNVAQVQQGIISASYTATYVNPIVQLYQASFNRTADSAGENYWVNQYASGAKTYQQIADSFANSAEFQSSYGVSASSAINEAVLTQFYLNILGRNPDSAGFSYWMSSGKNVGQVLSALSTSAEYQTDIAVPTTNFQHAQAAATAISNVSIFAQYGGYPQTAVQLTTATDNVQLSGHQAIYGTFNGTAASPSTLTVGDTINGNPGGNITYWNTITLSDIGGAATQQNPTGISGVSVNYVQSAIFNSPTGLKLDTSSTGTQGWAGLTNLSANTATNTANTAYNVITVADTTNVTLVDNSTVTGAATSSTVNGGKIITETVNNRSDNSAATILVNGGAGTTSVSITQTQAAGAADDLQIVSILDKNAGTTKAGTITTATVDGIDTAAVGINSNALATVTLNNIATTGAVVTLTETANASGLATTLALNLNTSNQSTAMTSAWTGIDLANAGSTYKTLNITAGSGTAASTGYNNTKIASFSNGAAASYFDKVETMTVNGTGELIAAGTHGTDLAALKSLSISGTGGLSFNATGNTAKLTSISATNSGSFVNALTIDGTAQSYSHTGTTQDRITVAGQVSKALSAGTGTSDTLVYNAAAPGAGGFLTKNGGTLTGFEVLGTGGATTGTFDFASIGSSFKAIDVTGTLAGATTFTNAAVGTTLAIDSDVAQAIVFQAANATGTSDTLGLTVGVSTTDARVLSSLIAETSTAQTVGSLTVQDNASVGFGTVNVVSNNSTANTANIITLLTDTKLANLGVSGTGALTITTLGSDTSTSLTVTDTGTNSSASSITNFTDSSLNSLTFAGTHQFNFGTITDTGSTLTITDNNAATNTIATLTAVNLSTLNLAGTSNVAITTLTDSSSSLLTINNTESASSGVTIGTLTGTALTSLTLNGTNSTTITTFTDGGTSLTITDNSSANQTVTTLTAAALTTETFNNTSTGLLKIGTHTATALVTANLTGNVDYTATGAAALTTVNGGTDNAAVSIVSTNNAAQTITLGDGNNTFTNTSLTTLANNATIVVGNGNNTISIGAATYDGGSSITFGSGFNSISVDNTAARVQADTFTVGASNGGTASVYTTLNNLIYTGAAKDTITFHDAVKNSTINDEGTVTSIQAGIDGISASAGYNTFTYGGNTWIYANTGTHANDELIQIVGTHTFTGTSTTVLTLAS